MSRTEQALQRLSAAVDRLEAAADHKAATGVDVDAALRGEVDRLQNENQELADKVQAESEKNRGLGKRLDEAIAKLNRVLEQN